MYIVEVYRHVEFESKGKLVIEMTDSSAKALSNSLCKTEPHVLYIEDVNSVEHFIKWSTIARVVIKEKPL